MKSQKKSQNYFFMSLLSLLITTQVFAHARLLPGGTLPPRNILANKSGPCGSPRTTTPTFLIAGQQLTVQFEEFVEHPGFYRIAFSPSGDLGFDQNILLNNILDVQGGALPHNYSRVVTVPNTPCNQCTIQMIQYMTENNPPSLYFSCADIVILPQGSVLPTTNPSPTPTASASPQPTPTSTTVPTTGPPTNCSH